MAGPIKMWMLITSASTLLESPDWLNQAVQFFSEIKMEITYHFNLEGAIFLMQLPNFHQMKMAKLMPTTLQKLTCMA